MSNQKVKTQEDLDQAYLQQWQKYGLSSKEEIEKALNDGRISHKTDPKETHILWSLDHDPKFLETRETKTSRFTKGIKRKRITFVKFQDLRKEKKS